MGSLCTHCCGHCNLFHWFLGKCFLVEVHPYITCFCTFWQSAFSVTCFGAFFGRWEQMCRCECSSVVDGVGMKVSEDA